MLAIGSITLCQLDQIIGNVLYPLKALFMIYTKDLKSFSREQEVSAFTRAVYT